MPNYKVIEDVEIDGQAFEKGVIVALEDSVAEEYVDAGFLELEVEKAAPRATASLKVGQDVFYQSNSALLRGKIVALHENGNADVLVSYDKDTTAEKNNVSQGYEYGQWRLKQ
jgi:ribosomal protein L35AE/L33A